jgi:hypothetical protein
MDSYIEEKKKKKKKREEEERKKKKRKKKCQRLFPRIGRKKKEKQNPNQLIK